MQNRCCVNGCFLNNCSKTRALIINFNDSAQLYFTSGIYCLEFRFGQFDQSEICTKMSFTSPELMTIIMKLPYTDV